MGGFFGVASREDCITSLFYGTDYHSHLGTKRGGLSAINGGGFVRYIHDITNAQFRTKFEDNLTRLHGRSGIGVIPASLAMQGLLKVIPDGRHAPMMANAGTMAGGENAWYRATLSELLDYLAAGKIHPIVAERIPLTEASRAHELIERGGYAGKVVLVP